MSERLMRRAIELSRGGYPAPNPHVGCVIAVAGTIVGEGFHDHAGGPHAEVVALRDARNRARGADAFVTLEPCAHHGRTPPCADALIQAGVARVFIACADPNPKATGGAERLRAAGIEVVEGLLADEAAEANRVFLSAMNRQRPYVIAKAATTLDGYIARPDGTSKWITNEASREAGHALRAEMGAVLVGSGTVLADEPQLTARLPGVVNQPARFVLDGTAKLGDEHQIFADANGFRIVAGAPASERDIAIPLASSGQFDLDALLAEMFRRGHIGLLVEGGATTVRSFLVADLVDELHLFIAPKLFLDGIRWTGEGPLTEINDRFELVETTNRDGDLHAIYRRKKISH